MMIIKVFLFTMVLVDGHMVFTVDYTLAHVQKYEITMIPFPKTNNNNIF